MRRAVRVLMPLLLENDRMRRTPATEPQMRLEGVRFGNLIDGFQVAASIRESENLARAARTNRLDRDPVGCRQDAVFEGKPEAGRDAVLEDLERHRTGIGLDPLCADMMIIIMPVITVTVAMMVMVPAAAQQ
jgi:hypothetical protein